MSRLGDLIHLERTRQKLTYKQVARKCGVSEKYLEEVESGRRIIQDDQARRILKTMGMQQQTEADFTLDDIAATVDLQSAMPAIAQAAEKGFKGLKGHRSVGGFRASCYNAQTVEGCKALVACMQEFEKLH